MLNPRLALCAAVISLSSSFSAYFLPAWLIILIIGGLVFLFCFAEDKGGGNKTIQNGTNYMMSEKSNDEDVHFLDSSEPVKTEKRSIQSCTRDSDCHDEDNCNIGFAKDTNFCKQEQGIHKKSEETKNIDGATTTTKKDDDNLIDDSNIVDDASAFIRVSSMAVFLRTMILPALGRRFMTRKSDASWSIASWERFRRAKFGLQIWKVNWRPL